MHKWASCFLFYIEHILKNRVIGGIKIIEVFNNA